MFKFDLIISFLIQIILLFLVLKTYLIILFIFSIRAVVPRAKIIDLIEFFWKNVLMIILIYMFFVLIIAIIFYI